MRTVVIGGSFDPVHIGHLFLAEEARCELGYERVIFIPSHKPPHKNLSNEATAEQRLEMLRLACDEWGFAIVDDTEIRRGGVSYTVDTIPEILRRHSISGNPGFILGDDLLSGFTTWKSHELLPQMVDIIIAHRLFESRLDVPFRHRYLDNLLLPVSSSNIRQRVREGRAFRHIVPDRVFHYIESNNLYGKRS